MVQLLVVILDNMKTLPDLLKAWEKIGVPGVTILESAGGYRLGSWLSQVGLAAIDRLFESGEVRRRTLLAVIDDESLLERAIAEAERVVGGFERPGTGIWMVLPVGRAGGLNKPIPKAAEQPPPGPPPPDWVLRRDMPVSSLYDTMRLRPTIVRPESPLEEVVKAMLANPETHVACVVSEDGRLSGLLDVNTVADNLLLRILPEEMLRQVLDLEDVMEFARRSQIRTAADAMQAPAFVKASETVKDAFHRMHERRLPGLPVVDESYHILGYLSLMNLLSLFADSQIGPQPSNEE